MAEIYSTRAAAGVIAAGATTVVYTVPAGTVFVLRCVDVVSTGAAGSELALELTGVATPIFYTSTAVSQHFQWTGRQVFNAGDTITLATAGGAWSFMLSGYSLLS
jgi:hypothetical protein